MTGVDFLYILVGIGIGIFLGAIFMVLYFLWLISR